MTPGTSPIGLIAGKGKFPLIFARETRKRGRDLVVVALKEEVSEDFSPFAKAVHPISAGKLDSIIQVFRKEGVREVVMAGRLEHTKLFSDIVPDLRTAQLLLRVKDRRADSVLGAVAEELSKDELIRRQEQHIKARSSSRPKDEWFDWLNGKWLDTAAPQGPWLVTADDIRNPQDLDISTFVNGARKQHNSTGQMLYFVADIIEYISAIITLEPGDIISTGTISGVGATTGTFLKPGDRVEIEISKIGVLKNNVAASKK